MSRHIFTDDERRRGGHTAGKLRAAQDSFYAHQVQIAPLGYRRACELHGEERILEKAIAKQRAHPSRPEQAAMQLLRRLGRVDYIHVHRPWSDRRYTVDFAWPAEQIAIEVLGGVHSKPELTHDPDRFARLQRKLDLLRADGWRVLTLDIRHQPTWETALRDFLGAEIPF